MTTDKEKGICIRLKSPWLGTPAGAKLHVWEHVANELFRRGVCEIIDDKFEPKEEVVIEENVIEEKAIESPKKDKMVKAPNKSKGFM